MGTQAGPGGFLSGLLSIAGPKLKERQDEHLRMQQGEHDAKFNTYQDAMKASAMEANQLITSGKVDTQALSQKLQSKQPLSPDEKRYMDLMNRWNYSNQEFTKLIKGNKPALQTWQKISGVAKQLLTRPHQGGSQEQGGAQPSAGDQKQAQTPPNGGRAASLTPPQSAAMPQEMQTQAMAGQKPDSLRRVQEADEAGLKGRDRAEFLETGKVPSQPAAGNRKPERWKVDGKDVDVDVDPKTGTRYQNGQEWEIPEGATRVASSVAMPRFGGQLVMLKDAKSLKKSGQKFVDPEGNPLDLDKLPEGMALQPLAQAGGQISYVPIDPKYQKYVFGNQAYASTPQELPQLASGGGTLLGQQNVGSTSTHEVAAVDANGNPIAQKLTGSRTPNVAGPGANRMTAPQSAAAKHQSGTAAPQQQHPRNPVIQKRNGESKPVGAVPAAPPPSAGARPLPGMQAGTYNRMLDRITSVREAATQIFGDPSQPSMQSMQSWAPLPEDPESRDRIGKALLLTFEQMDKATGGAGITGAVGPVSLHAGGGVIDLLEKAFRVPAGQAELTNGIMQRAIQSLTPEEREAYDATMSTFSVVVGLRSLTKASAAQASVAAIEREIPTIGLFTADSRQYMDRLNHLAEVVYNGTKGIPKDMWDQNPGLYDYLQTLPEKTKAKKSVSPKNATAITPAGTNSNDPLGILK